ncbi:MAG TPA: hypothetical protein VFO89_01135 [Thermoanaerobaculia bacterium]|nr:hypothetical protein [Thermoanaerobaculia bacterium]
MSHADFHGRRAVLERTITIHAGPETVFPLLCPVREAEWIDGWIGRAVFAESGVAEENGVYVTRRDDGGDTIWLVTRHDPVRHEIELVYFMPGLQANRLFVRVEPLAREKSAIAVRYVRTGLSESGNESVAAAEAQFGTMMDQWESSLDAYVAGAAAGGR